MDYGALTYTNGTGTDQQVKLRLGSMTVGRAPENDFVLDDDAVARIHLRVFCTPDGCSVMDLGSQAGTFLNQVRLQPNMRHPLRDGDTLRIGRFTLRYALLNPSFDINAQPSVLPPEIAAKLPQLAVPPVRRLRGNGVPRRTRRELSNGDGASSYMKYLAPCYHEDEFLGRFLLIFESILDPLERMIDQLDLYFDPRLAPEALMPWLASWVDLTLNEKWSVEQRRALIRAAPDLYRWRGTRRGLREYLRIYCGVEPAITDREEERRGERASRLGAHVFRVVLDVPDPDLIDRELVHAIIDAEKPAHASYLLEIRRASVSSP